MQARQVKMCKLSDKDLALLAVKAMEEKGAREVTDVHVKTFMKIVKKYCEVFMEKYSVESP